jgi:hypothetical protein
MYRPPAPELHPQARLSPLLRFVERTLTSHPDRTRKLLQQAYVNPDGTLQWVDVPFVREEDVNAR